MSEIFRDVEGIEKIADDILIYRESMVQCNEMLRNVLEHVMSVDLKLNPKKLHICNIQVAYIGLKKS